MEALLSEGDIQHGYHQRSVVLYFGGFNYKTLNSGLVFYVLCNFFTYSALTYYLMMSDSSLSYRVLQEDRRLPIPVGHRPARAGSRLRPGEGGQRRVGGAPQEGAADAQAAGQLLQRARGAQGGGGQGPRGQAGQAAGILHAPRRRRRRGWR